jgi:Ca-activated chloride channel homolog
MRAALVLTLFAAVAAAPAAQQAVFRAEASTVSLYPSVRDANGRLVDNLTIADFQVFDAGKPAKITTFSNDIVPITVAVMLDMSTSMIGEQERVRDAGLRFVDLLMPFDRARIGTFGDEIAVSPWLTADKAILQRVLHEEVWPGGSTPLWSAMRAAMNSLKTETGRRVILVLSDGIDTGCARRIGIPFAPGDATFTPPARIGDAVVSDSSGVCAKFADVQKLAGESDFMIYSIGLEGPGLATGLRQLADDTGGGRFELRRLADLGTTFGQVADELHHQYAIGFTPVGLDGTLHQLEVRLTKPGLIARARRTYMASDR